MFLVKKPTVKEPTALEKAIERVTVQMSDVPCESKEYAQMTDQLVKLMKLQEEVTSKRIVSKDTLAVIAGNLAGILLIIGHERVHVVTSKALSFVMKAAR